MPQKQTSRHLVTKNPDSAILLSWYSKPKFCLIPTDKFFTPAFEFIPITVHLKLGLKTLPTRETLLKKLFLALLLSVKCVKLS